MNAVSMSIYSTHHSVPYAIHETRRYPRNVRLWVFFLYAESFFFSKKEKKREETKKTKIQKKEEEEEEGKEMFQMTTKAATAIAQKSHD